MKKLGLFFCVALLVACSSNPASRAKQNQALFDTWPLEVQARLKNGVVQVGDTQEMVRVALGDPDESSVQAKGERKFFVWGYRKSSPSVNLSLGLGGLISPNVGLGGSVGKTVGGGSHYTAIVAFELGKVVELQQFD